MDEYYNQLISYVKDVRAQGYSDSAIRTVLTQRSIDVETIDRLLLDVQPNAKTPIPAKHNQLYTAGMKLGTLSVITAVFFLVRTTGALQQNIATTPTDGQQPVALQPETSSDPRISSSVISTSSPSPSPSTTPSPSPTPSQSTQVVPVTASKPTTSATAPAPSTSVAPPAPKPTPTPTPTPSPQPTYTYRNGTYTAVASSNTPAGQEKISITLVVTNDIVTSTSATNMASNPTSSNYENTFINNYKSLVVGKPLKTLSLGKVSNASLTPIAFNNAATAIRSQAL